MVPLMQWSDRRQFVEAFQRSPFVGREPELASLLTAWGRVRNGDKAVIFLSGEPGIGKTRLAAQLAANVRADGGYVLSGRCDEEGLIAYQPFVQALREHLLAATGDIVDLKIAPFASDLARLLPELRS